MNFMFLNLHEKQILGHFKYGFALIYNLHLTYFQTHTLDLVRWLQKNKGRFKYNAHLFLWFLDLLPLFHAFSNTIYKYCHIFVDLTPLFPYMMDIIFERSLMVLNNKCRRSQPDSLLSSFMFNIIHKLLRNICVFSLHGHEHELIDRP